MVTTDASSTKTQQQLSDSVFGTDGDQITLKSQIEDCSHGRLSITEAYPRNNGNYAIVDGATTVNLDVSITGNENIPLVNLIYETLKSNFGVSTPNKLANHVMMCFPAGYPTYSVGDMHFGNITDNWEPNTNNWDDNDYIDNWKPNWARYVKKRCAIFMCSKLCVISLLYFAVMLLFSSVL